MKSVSLGKAFIEWVLIKDSKSRNQKKVRGKEKCTHSVQEIPILELFSQFFPVNQTRFSEIIKTM